ncbi:MAG: FUSC family protein [Tuberibacillus sp.]
MRLGARIIKTGLAITLSIYLSMWLGLTPVSMAAVASAFAIQPSVYRSWQSIVENVQGNIIGAIIASLFVLLVGNHPIVIGIAVIVVIAIHIKMKLNDTITLSTVTVILIMSGTPSSEGFLAYALHRFSAVMLGVGAAFVVNMLFMPPNYENRLYHAVVNNTTKLMTWVRLLLQHAPEKATVKVELKQLQDQRERINDYFKWYKDERKYARRKRHAKHRKIVIFRQMITTTNRLNELLRKMNESEHLLAKLPEDIQRNIQSSLENMLVSHERILMRFNGKVRDAEESPIETFQLKEKLTDAFIPFFQKQTNSEWLHLFPLVAMIIDYGHQIEHLDTLMDSFHNFHKKDNKVEVKQEED